jgi:hypothetical protein
MATLSSKGRKSLKTEVRPLERQEENGPVAERADSLEALLRRPAVGAPGGDPHETRAGGVRLGVLQELDAQGHAHVRIDGQIQPQVCAGTLVALQAGDLGRRVALGFAEGDARYPVLLGLLLEDAPAAVSAVSVERRGERIVIEATEELELRCGEAVVLLQADGRIQLRGVYLTSHASATQRIRGGSVQIN